MVSVGGTRSCSSTSGKAPLGQIARSLINVRPVITGTVSDRNARVHELSGAVPMANAQFRDLADASADGALVALAAGLGIVNRAKSIADRFHLFKCFLILLVSILIDQAIRRTVKSRGSLNRASTRNREQKCPKCESQSDVSHWLPSLWPHGVFFADANISSLLSLLRRAHARHFRHTRRRLAEVQPPMLLVRYLIHRPQLPPPIEIALQNLPRTNFPGGVPNFGWPLPSVASGLNPQSLW